MSAPDAFQLSAEAAEVYEATFVPALFGAWAIPLVEAAEVAPGQTVVDVACGTGVVARAAADRVGDHGRVVGVDVNPGMLAVARRLRPDIEWRQADAADLPFPDRSVDVVTCQAALMFLPDPAAALREMARVVVPGGTVAVQVWSRLEAQIGWAPFYDVVARHAGPAGVALISTYWRLGDLPGLTGLFGAAGLRVQQTLTRVDAARFSSVEEFVGTEVDGTPLRDRISDRQYAAIVADAHRALAAFTAPDGRLEVPIEGHIVIARPADDGAEGPGP